MELELIRSYFPEGTNGKILFDREFVCYAIELPWKNNHARVSCIPEGRYELIKKWSLKFRRHWWVPDVVARSDILIHPANDAMHELKGCIAPVSLITGSGKGLLSRAALEKLNALAEGSIRGRERIFLTIKSVNYESD